MEKCTFLLCNRKVPKECTQAGANLRIRPPWGSPHSRGDASRGRTHPCQSQHPAERRLLGSALRPRSYSPEHSLQLTLGRLTIDAPPRRPEVRPGGGVCGTNGSRNENFTRPTSGTARHQQTTLPAENRFRLNPQTTYNRGQSRTITKAR